MIVLIRIESSLDMLFVLVIYLLCWLLENSSNRIVIYTYFIDIFFMLIIIENSLDSIVLVYIISLIRLVLFRIN